MKKYRRALYWVVLVVRDIRRTKNTSSSFQSSQMLKCNKQKYPSARGPLLRAFDAMLRTSLKTPTSSIFGWALFAARTTHHHTSL